jgi:hypothetical protein
MKVEKRGFAGNRYIPVWSTQQCVSLQMRAGGSLNSLTVWGIPVDAEESPRSFQMNPFLTNYHMTVHVTTISRLHVTPYALPSILNTEVLYHFISNYEYFVSFKTYASI